MDMIKCAKPYIGGAEIEMVRQVLNSTQLAQGNKVKRFESNFAETIGTKYAIAVNSGTAALHSALLVAGVEKGDEVVVPPMTFFATISAVLMTGATPVFVDVLPDTFCMDPRKFESAISPRTTAVIPVHLFGGAVEMDHLLAIARDHKVVVIEDCAQAHCTKYKTKRVGSFGDMGCFSFYATKHMTTGGEGGMILSDNANYHERLKLLRSHGMDSRDSHILLGYNYRMTELSAAIGLAQLDKLEPTQASRIHVSNYLYGKLQGNPWLTLPKLHDYVEHSYFWFPILVDENKLGHSVDYLISQLNNMKIEVRYRYNKPLFEQPVLKYYPFIAEKCPVANEVAGKVVGLPNRPDMSIAELDHVISAINSF